MRTRRAHRDGMEVDGKGLRVVAQVLVLEVEHEVARLEPLPALLALELEGAQDVLDVQVRVAEAADDALLRRERGSASGWMGGRVRARLTLSMAGDPS